MSNIEHSAEHRAAPNIEAVRIEVSQPEPILSDAEKLDYLYTVARKVAALVDSVSPAQIEQVKKIQRNPLLSKLFSGIIPGND